MSDPAGQTPVSLESIKARLVSLVEAASKSGREGPVRLTYVGGEFAKETGVAFEKRLAMLAENGQVVVPKAKRKLAPFVHAYCSDVLELTRDPTGIFTISLRAAPDAIPTGPAPPAPTFRFHRAVWAAFIRPIEGGKRFLNMDEIGFTNAATRPSAGNWCEIEARFVLGAASGAAVDGTALQKNIEEWARANDVDISRLVVQAPERRPRYGRLDQLLDIVDALPEAVAAGWAIPANVLRHLRDAR